jgi:branched-chain amino acid aminotransferase
MLSTLKTNTKILNVIASIYADENAIDNCILLNEKKQLVEALNANIFLVKGNQILTPSLSEGCVKGILRKNIIAMIQKDSKYDLIETEISPFELQKVDEVFITNTIMGIQSVTKYRKKEYNTTVATDLQNKLKNLEKLS